MSKTWLCMIPQPILCSCRLQNTEVCSTVLVNERQFFHKKVYLLLLYFPMTAQYLCNNDYYIMCRNQISYQFSISQCISIFKYCDSWLLPQACDLSIDECSFTGETEPAPKRVDVLTKVQENGIAHRTNLAFMGTLVRCGNGKVMWLQWKINWIEMTDMALRVALMFLATACFARRGLSHHTVVIDLYVYIYIHIQ